MPGEVVDRPNAPPGASLLPDSILDLRIDLNLDNVLPAKDLANIALFRRAANYIAAAMIFLQSNTDLSRPLTFSDIKPRLLGHWGTCPGLTLVYSHLNTLIRDTSSEILLVVGPGHGAPAILATLWLEGSLERFYPQYSRDRKGLENLIKGFSTPAGFPSHINAEVPGAIHEGGELGYALGVAYGAVLDKPDLIAAVVVGDGEAETGPTATAWHAHKFLDPAESGAVIPVLHVNGYKISESTVFGCMDDRELVALFTGYGYKVRIVENLERMDEDMAASLRWAHSEIREIQKKARGGDKVFKPRWPMIVMKTPKGWTGPKKYKDVFIEGSFKAHQVPIPDAGKDKEGLETLQDWLSSYKPAELFSETGAPIDDILSTLPSDSKKLMGQLPNTFSEYAALSLPKWQEFTKPALSDEVSSMQALGSFLASTIDRNPTTFRIFSPDELESNKLSETLTATSRTAQHTSPPTTGRIIELLSEHTLQSFLQGYTLTGRTALFPSYESFLGIVHTMMVQYSKFQKLASTRAPWRGPTSSINYLETSTWARQEHNGFSHQNPSFIGAVLNLKPNMARVYLPPDANCALSVMHHCLASQNLTNLIVGSKQPTPVYLSQEQADEHCERGAGIFDFASCQGDPEVVLVAIGTETTFEVVHAAAILKQHNIAARVVNVVDLFVIAAEDTHPHALPDADFNELFTPNCPLVVNYHGYVNEVVSLLWKRVKGDRVVKVGGYREEGSTTTPFAMMLENGVDRWTVVKEAVRGLQEVGSEKGKGVVEEMERLGKECTEFILKEGVDMDGIYDMPEFK